MTKTRELPDWTQREPSTHASAFSRTGLVEACFRRSDWLTCVVGGECVRRFEFEKGKPGRVLGELRWLARQDRLWKPLRECRFLKRR